ncbi:24298_t:CDS:10, partial [Entrophospora sp. SA101]
FLSSGTYGRVYKVKLKQKDKSQESSSPEEKEVFLAIKKFKPDKEGEPNTYTGISQSACREISLCRELHHENVIELKEVLLEDTSINMVLDYAEHDFLQIIHHHSQNERKPIPEFTVKSFLWQLLNGVAYLHANWILHRDLKPANILVIAEGVVKIGDLGLARIYSRPLQPLYNGDKVVVTIWYRAPELLLGSKHYTTAIDIWAVGCIFAELLTLRPIFKGEEAKMDSKKNVPFQKNQLIKIFDVLGTPTKDQWPTIDQQPEYHNILSMKQTDNRLKSFYQNSRSSPSEAGFDLLAKMLEYDPTRRINAEDALNHPYFSEEPLPSMESFKGQPFQYPLRTLKQDDSDVKVVQPVPGTVVQSQQQQQLQQSGTSSQGAIAVKKHNQNGKDEGRPVKRRVTPSSTTSIITKDQWPTIDQQPEYHNILSMKQTDNRLKSFYQNSRSSPSEAGFDLLAKMLEYDPTRRINAEDALNHPYFSEEPLPSMESFKGQPFQYPLRTLKQDDSDVKVVQPVPGTVVQSQQQQQLQQSGTSSQGAIAVKKHNQNGKDEGRPVKRRG